MKRSEEFRSGLKKKIKKLKRKVIKTQSDEAAFITGIYNAAQERDWEFATVQVSVLLDWIDILINSLLDEKSIKELEKHRREDESWENSFQKIVCLAYLNIVDHYLPEMAKLN